MPRRHSPRTNNTLCRDVATRPTCLSLCVCTYLFIIKEGDVLIERITFSSLSLSHFANLHRGVTAQHRQSSSFFFVSLSLLLLLVSSSSCMHVPLSQFSIIRHPKWKSISMPLCNTTTAAAANTLSVLPFFFLEKRKNKIILSMRWKKQRQLLSVCLFVSSLFRCLPPGRGGRQGSLGQL